MSISILLHGGGVSIRFRHRRASRGRAVLAGGRPGSETISGRLGEGLTMRSGYQAAVLAELVGDVYTIELIPALADEAKARLRRLGYRNVHARAGDGYKGWPEEAPFDAVVVTCGADHVPAPLFEQLKPGGTLIIPVGKVTEGQVLQV